MKPMEAEMALEASDARAQHEMLQGAKELAALMDSAMARAAAMNIEDDHLRAFVESLVVTGEMVGQAPPDWRYKNYYDLVLDLSRGPKRGSLTLPDDIPPGELRQCYRNSWELALDQPDRFTFVEGFAFRTVLPVQHAWLEDADGNVVDPTWSNPELGSHDGEADEALYVGVRFDTATTMALSVETGWASVFGGDVEALDHRALRYGFTTDEGTVTKINGPEDM